MNELVGQFFKEYKQVRILNEENEIDWSEASQLAIDLPRGWFELSRVSTSDRISFVREFWQRLLPYHPEAHAKVSDFFSRLDEILVILSKKNEEDPLSAELIYSLYDNRSFFRGLPPADAIQIEELEAEIKTSLPKDYLSFLQIHNGFGKLSSLAVFPSEFVNEMRERVLEMLLESTQPLRMNGKIIDPGSLIPFFEEEGLFSFQCFYSEWYPASEMGNVYLSGIDYTISDISDRKSWRENFAFPTFMEWLGEYLEGMNVSP